MMGAPVPSFLHAASRPALLYWLGVCAILAPLLLAAGGCGRVGFQELAPGADTGTETGPRDSGAAADTATPPPAPICGDGEVNGTDACDDGNGANGDGCENDCTFTCTSDSECDDGAICNGAERCSPTMRVCEAGTALADGTTCADGGCRGGSCAPLGCGNGALEGGEDCDDANLIDGDGCENDCTYSCEMDTDCDDGDPCTGEACSMNVCLPAAPVPEGDTCDRDGDPVTRDLCLSGTCLPSVCGDAFVDPGASPPEDCDDDNSIPGDGCESDCTFTCENDADCDDGAVCNGGETCDLALHLCNPGTPAMGGAPCPGGACLGGMCLAGVGDGGVRFDGGFGMPCEVDADCSGTDHCCPICPMTTRVCYPAFLMCPEVLCTFDSGV